MGASFPEEDVLRIFNVIDRDGDGLIRYKELMWRLKQYDRQGWGKTLESENPQSDLHDDYYFEQIRHKQRPKLYRTDRGSAAARWARFCLPTGHI